MPRGRPPKDGRVVVKGPNYGSALKAIRKYCKEDCCAGQTREVELCQCAECTLYPHRFGMGPDVARSKGKKVDPPKTKETK